MGARTAWPTGRGDAASQTTSASAGAAGRRWGVRGGGGDRRRGSASSKRTSWAVPVTLSDKSSSQPSPRTTLAARRSVLPLVSRRSRPARGVDRFQVPGHSTASSSLRSPTRLHKYTVANRSNARPGPASPSPGIIWTMARGRTRRGPTVRVERKGSILLSGTPADPSQPSPPSLRPRPRPLAPVVTSETWRRCLGRLLQRMRGRSGSATCFGGQEGRGEGGRDRGPDRSHKRPQGWPHLARTER